MKQKWHFLFSYITISFAIISIFSGIATASAIQPVASFTANITEGQEILVVNFTDTSSNSPDQWDWKMYVLENASTISFSSLQNPVHLFERGNYSIFLNASNIDGFNISTQITWINVTESLYPIASFTRSPETGQTPLEVTFTDTSTGPGSFTYSWNFDDGSPLSTDQNPVHTFTTDGTFLINESVTNANGTSYATALVDTFTLAGFNRVDLRMDEEFILSVEFLDSQTLSPIPQVTIIDNFGNTETTTVGRFNHTYGYGTVVLYITATGYASKTVSYFIDSDRSEIVQLTPSDTQSQNTNVVYTQRQVRIRVLDRYSHPLSYVNLTLYYVASSLPSKDASFLTNAFGIAPSVAEAMINSSIAMTGITGNDGANAFMLFPSLTYGISMINSTQGVACYQQVAPTDVDYAIICPTTFQSFIQNGTRQQLANSYVWVTEPNMSFVTFNWQYKDSSGGTTDLWFNLTNNDNSTLVYSRGYGNPGTATILGNYTIPNIRGQQWKYSLVYTK